MGIFAPAADERVAGVRLSDEALSVDLMDGRTISVPLVWYPRLLNATASQRNDWRVAGGGYGIHWPDVDEDLSTEGLLRGAPAPNAVHVGFEHVWQVLTRGLKPGTIIPNWALRGHIGEPFTIRAISPSHVEIDAPGAKHLQRVSRQDFERIFAVWPKYKAGMISRAALRDLFRFSKYVISILKWMEQQGVRE